ncbi:Bifunctional inhibitor/plant lipid transfer protein/seed storage helical domain [Macleaya cordata]|uniref:Bifunctional inhibitor/plant lipid transfer protein/seed storage helical domain n=1 Tax=Macleaya cordata TaxID=56857 RepID=A0A200QTE1_MACCD|nr:Bifunctional inhibitor/plant lipid transfer protein/seed storage helical domain [Macleaya cordata]
MTMKTTSCTYIAVLMVAFVLVLSHEATVSTVAAATCNVNEFQPCYSLITSPDSPVSPEACCTVLKQRQNCICEFLVNPNFKNLVNPKNAEALAKRCGLAPPKC